MDRSKIRKKAKEKEIKAEIQPTVIPAEAGADEVIEKITSDVQERHFKNEFRDKTTGGSIVVSPLSSAAEMQEVSSIQGNVETVRGQGEEKPAGTILELITFSLAREEFAFRVSEMEEIVRHQRITKVPTLPNYVCGITSLRGKIIAVIDLKTRLSLQEMADGEPTAGTCEINDARDEQKKILVLNGPKGPIGAIIDKVFGVVRFPVGDLLEPPTHLSEEELKFIEGIVIFEKRFISIIRSTEALNIEVS